ncbi:SycD/LcrH family type III secretion system chaperone [Candidatus Protochlamydia phocaeensis]|uniref:SycD/LcrH family type III secretion system chaperone n=1 Tax=Candidatus Protochlamydia phocaeensis TaxID=1414722 RepID=UPI0008388C23|nr:SycD/LcrH family type III secretion system chaperone [Candidatus Protochlamydia phocaeensis]
MKDDLSEFRLSKKVKEKLKNKKLLQKELAEGKTAQEILGFSDSTMAKFYGAAYQLFEHKRYVDAANAFLFLATLNLHNHDYWLGLGMATQMCQDYEAAIDAYELAALCDISSPVPYFYLAKCLFAIHDRESALQALDLAIETSNEFEEYAELKRQAQEAKRILLKHDGFNTSS